MIVYKAVNTLNSKVYIGQTIKTLHHRKRAHFIESKLKKTYFAQALQKYGQESFTWEILRVCSSRKELDEVERRYISEYSSTNRKLGYNLTSGGQKRFTYTKKKELDKVCPNCKNEFHARSHIQKFCSKSCSVEYRMKKNAAWREDRQKICKECGVPYYRTQKESTFCSRKCGLAWKVKYGPKGKDHHTWKIEKDKNCLNCGNEFHDRFHQKKKFCSQKCSGEYYSGSRHPFWNPERHTGE